jgi:hypothetical protein
MGHALALNWKWKDNDHAIFPWGIVFPGDWTPKDELYTYRNTALLFRAFHPLAGAPTTAVLLPGAHLGADYALLMPYLLELCNSLICLGVDFTVIDEADLWRLPTETRTLIYPLPHRAPAHVFPLLRDLVQRGASLCLIGGDEALADRSEAGAALRELLGAEPKGWLGPWPEHLSGLSAGRALPRQMIKPTTEPAALQPYEGQPCVRLAATEARVAAVAADDAPVVLLRDLGAGHVLSSSDITPAGARAILPAFLGLAGIPWREPDPLGAQVFTRPTEEGTVHVVITSPWDRAPRTVEVETPRGPMCLGLGQQGVGLVALTTEGAPCAVEGISLREPSGEIQFESTEHAMLLTAGTADLRTARGLLLLPVGPGTVRLRTDVALEALAGDIVDGQWVTRGRLDLAQHDGWATVTTDTTSARALILLTTAEDRDAHVAWVQSLCGGESRTGN